MNLEHDAPVFRQGNNFVLSLVCDGCILGVSPSHSIWLMLLHPPYPTRTINDRLGSNLVIEMARAGSECCCVGCRCRRWRTRMFWSWLWFHPLPCDLWRCFFQLHSVPTCVCCCAFNKLMSTCEGKNALFRLCVHIIRIRQWWWVHLIPRQGRL